MANILINYKNNTCSLNLFLLIATYQISKTLLKNSPNAYTKIPQHERVNLSARTCQDIITNVSRPRHVRVEVNLTIFLRNGPGSFPINSPPKRKKGRKSPDSRPFHLDNQKQNYFSLISKCHSPADSVS